MEAQLPFLFVYGTLMRGFTNPFASKLSAHSTFLGEGFFSGRLYRVSWYPGAIYDAESIGQVYGEMYRLHDFQTLIEELDVYEDVRETEAESLYIRRKIPVHTENGQPQICWTYLYNQSLTEATLLVEGKFTPLVF